MTPPPDFLVGLCFLQKCYSGLYWQCVCSILIYTASGKRKCVEDAVNSTPDWAKYWRVSNWMGYCQRLFLKLLSPVVGKSPAGNCLIYILLGYLLILFEGRDIIQGGRCPVSWRGPKELLSNKFVSERRIVFMGKRWSYKILKVYWFCYVKRLWYYMHWKMLASDFIDGWNEANDSVCGEKNSISLCEGKPVVETRCWTKLFDKILLTPFL